MADPIALGSIVLNIGLDPEEGMVVDLEYPDDMDPAHAYLSLGIAHQMILLGAMQDIEGDEDD